MEIGSKCGCVYNIKISLDPVKMCELHLATILPNNNDGNLICSTERFKFYISSFGRHTSYNSFTDSVEKHIIDEVWHFKPDDVVMDVGAAFGTYTLPALADGARVIAFEPNPKLVELFVRNVVVNGWTDRCLIKSYGLGARTDEIPYNERDLSTTGQCKSTIKIKALDDVIDEFHLDRLDMIKVDIEGMEVEFLKGALDTILQYKPRLLIEIHDTGDQIVKWLTDESIHTKVDVFKTGREYFHITPLLTEPIVDNGRYMVRSK